MGLLFVAPHHGLSTQRTAGCRLLFYVVAGKMLVSMRLDGRGGRMARFGINKGGVWEVPLQHNVPHG
jgi:mannose-6-phosphate isomerase-like protein (cupin superfamily)